MTMPTRHFMCAITHPLYLLQTKHAKTLHFCQPFCRRAPPLTTIWPPRAHPLNTTKHRSTREPGRLQLTRNRKSTCTSCCHGRDWPAKTLRTKPLGTRGQDARRWSQDQENFIEQSYLDCEIHLTAILEKCTDTIVLHQLGTKDYARARC